ncbi:MULTISPECIES: hypothetical protein [Yersinia]|uniref:hypothetical protein n=1 Tax=Yersinia TaxID=629 RepID=UPI000EB5A984|nr:hypothetical protein [Yersinia sp. IP36721]
MQKSVIELVKMGKLPSEDCSDITLIEKYQNVIDSIIEPVSDDDACELVSIFGEDECYGLGWTLLHKIETAPNWPIKSALSNIENEWIMKLKERAGY